MVFEVKGLDSLDGLPTGCSFTADGDGDGNSILVTTPNDYTKFVEFLLSLPRCFSVRVREILDSEGPPQREQEPQGLLGARKIVLKGVRTLGDFSTLERFLGFRVFCSKRIEGVFTIILRRETPLDQNKLGPMELVLDALRLKNPDMVVSFRA